ncbi:MAG: hypothetical protein ABF461_00725 [Zymomonas mobilis subsp. pomaceae]|uniref:Cytochrome c family protein n=1 Tax=Zymomonas mobilis subsp. pomaceae (strain ATCC 29192 / DSM 22645 / JCM 10191 / CCUG 17912 / NBRC 13757 / NCIMB 11200 / NRRL B-4491 / Barker I) TaxID=579138 RepID=F8EVE3_ZYMMT|nr:hypothetical protein [Zymomonas mobilis]AEI37350.1 hypothetical protein Zymop_0447 [Zymomonas mobilis subsp. pomaceae ATCC 29192]MDX5948718.1 hypothetical protein [Zymomonas mobilis subsp. pomaceae]GEB88523.1 hypothetical protein ZMO02_01600 [Zymomonas mobilis subsp. pomaceae]
MRVFFSLFVAAGILTMVPPAQAHEASSVAKKSMMKCKCKGCHGAASHKDVSHSSLSKEMPEKAS